jgi:hypothetical protein
MRLVICTRPTTFVAFERVVITIAMRAFLTDEVVGYRRFEAEYGKNSCGRMNWRILEKWELAAESFSKIPGRFGFLYMRRTRKVDRNMKNVHNRSTGHADE